MASFQTFLGLLRNLPQERRGRFFEQCCKHLLRTARPYSDTLESVWLWNEWPGRWGPDCGIDLVARTKTGKYWAIQCKAWNPHASVTKADIDSFLAESNRDIISYRLLIATTDKVSINATRTISKQARPAGTLLCSDIAKLLLEWPESIRSFRPHTGKKFTPKKHQREAILKVTRGLTKVDRGQLIMACGTGKTLLGLWISESMGSTRTLVLVPSLSLLGQTLSAWVQHSSRRFEFLPVCSDPTVASEEDAVVTTVAGLGYPTTTDERTVARFLRRLGPLVVFATYQSSAVISKAQALRQVPSFDLIIADEAHRCSGLEGTDFTRVLDSTAIKSKNRFFMTATPRFFTGRVKREAAEKELEIASMDDTNRFGPIFYHLPFSKAIKRKLLTDYEVHVVCVDNETYRRYAQEGKFVTRDGRSVEDARALASQIAVAKAMRQCNLKRVLSFHTFVRNARRFSDSFVDVVKWMPQGDSPKGRIWAKHVEGKMTVYQRQLHLQQFDSLGPEERGLLANARCLAEGVDVPTIDGVAFVDPRRSQIDIVQAVGRAIRKADRKGNYSTIIIPVFINQRDNPEMSLVSSEFDTVWQVVKALRSHDDDLAEQLDSIARGLGRRETSTLKGVKRIRLNIPTRISKSFSQAFRLRLVKETTASWEFWFGLLGAYISREGTSNISQKHSERGRALGSWVSVQRRAYRKGTLLPDQIDRLEKLPDWTWHARETDWEEAFQLFVKFVHREKHARIPRDHFEAGLNLGQWVTNQRVRRTTLSKERVRQFNEHGFIWDWRDTYWDRLFEIINDYVSEVGNARPSRSLVRSGEKVGEWVQNQRSLYQRDLLIKEQIKKLESLKGWTWNAREALWETMFDALKQFADSHDHCTVPPNFRVNGRSLKTWVRARREDYTRDRLDEKRIERFEKEIRSWSWSGTRGSDKDDRSRWMENFNWVQAYVTRKGHARVPQDYVDGGLAIGRWVTKQRVKHTRNTLARKEGSLLGSLPGWSWNPKEDSWLGAFELAKKYIRKHADSRIPVDYEMNNRKLGQWAAQQRQLYRLRKLRKDRAKSLSILKGWVWES